MANHGATPARSKFFPISPGKRNPAWARTPRLVGYTLHALTPEKRVPWHRVVGVGGKISLGGEGYTTQRKILESEGVEFNEKGNIPLARSG